MFYYYYYFYIIFIKKLICFILLVFSSFLLFIFICLLIYIYIYIYCLTCLIKKTIYDYYYLKYFWNFLIYYFLFIFKCFFNIKNKNIPRGTHPMENIPGHARHWKYPMGYSPCGTSESTKGTVPGLAKDETYF